MIKKRMYCQPRTRIVRLGSGRLCDQDMPAGMGGASGADKSTDLQLANSISFGFGDEDSGGSLWAYE